MPGYERYGDETPPHVLGGPAARSHEELGRSNAIYHGSQGNVPKSVLTHKDFVRELTPDGEIQQLLEEI